MPGRHAECVQARLGCTKLSRAGTYIASDAGKHSVGARSSGYSPHRHVVTRLTEPAEGGGFGPWGDDPFHNPISDVTYLVGRLWLEAEH